MYTLGKSHNFVYLMFQLLLSGDVELNPGPLTGKIHTLNMILIKLCALVTAGNPRTILRKNFTNLTNAISINLVPVAGALFAEELIPEGANRGALVVGLGDYRKASELMIVLQSLLEASSDKRQYLINVCNVLKDLVGTKDIAITMLQELGVNVSDSIQQGIDSYHGNHGDHFPTCIGTSTKQQSVPPPATGAGREEPDTG